MKTIATTLGVARSNVLKCRDGDRPRRGPQERAGDVELADAIRRLVEVRSSGQAPVNAKSAYIG